MREYALKHGATFAAIQNSTLHNKIDFDMLSVSKKNPYYIIKKDLIYESFLSKVKIGEGKKSNNDVKGVTGDSKNLFVLPGQCNFSGRKYAINEISSCIFIYFPSLFLCYSHSLTQIDIKNNFSQWRVLVDGASLVGTSPIDLSDNRIFLISYHHSSLLLIFFRD